MDIEIKNNNLAAPSESKPELLLNKSITSAIQKIPNQSVDLQNCETYEMKEEVKVQMDTEKSIKTEGHCQKLANKPIMDNQLIHDTKLITDQLKQLQASPAFNEAQPMLNMPVIPMHLL